MKQDINSAKKNVPEKIDFLQKMMKFFLNRNKLFTSSWIALSVIVVAISIPGSSFSEERPAIDDVVQKLQLSYESAKDLSADFIQETTVKSIKKTQREEGRVFFKNPQNMSWNYTKPQGKKLVMNHQTAWLYLPQEKVAYRQSAESIFQSRLLIDFFSGSGKLKDDFIITYDSAISPDKDGHYLLVLTPRQKNTTFNVLRLTIDKNNFYILRLSFDDAFGNSTDLRFSRIQFNTGLPKTFFLFKPPKGVQVFEMP